ncbi:TetR/AcrR family transcriptional regulator [Phenylobacterium aquaticum]|uniref:TetR/AcrR family transcriptional regulator n=1 Tax=Phenylobacterium aquaticum TaxID=1763816 RepID=UPI0026F195BB|nr:TetR/AcrR family transcriptional regulator [Phenylobacterium aquaticum]
MSIPQQLEPEGLAADGQGWQQRKSAQTRVAILEAAVDCLEKHGYARTTTQMIAQMADISRGAMLHHYATKQELVAALIDYTFYKRIELFTASIANLTEVERVQEQVGIELYWESLQTREWSAYLELLVASRTDAELSEIFLPKARRYDQVERDVVLKVFPEWASDPSAYELAMDYCIAAMEGLLLNREIWDDAKRRVIFRTFISNTLLQLRGGKVDLQGRITGKA